METSIINGMCRCCASEGAFKDVKTTYHWMGEEEVYSVMLKDCFDINLSSQDEHDGSGICEVCITQLRNAVNFKKQVLQTEEQFQKQVRNKLFKPAVVKVEVSGEEDNDSDDHNADDNDDDYSGNEFEIPIKTEDPEETSKPKKRAAKPTTSRAKKARADDGESSTKQTPRRSTRHRPRSPSPILIEDKPKLTLDKKTNFSCFISIRPVGRTAPQSIRNRQKKIAEQKRLTELHWHIDNIRTVLSCSNATPVRCKVGSRYACCYCLDQFQTLADLKTHSIEMHENGRPDFFSTQRSLSKHIVNLDITDLSCKLCDKNIDSLELLMDHLKSYHDELIHTSIKNQIVPFRADGDKMVCAVCSDEIEDFEDLQPHMSSHYRNYICEFCDASFVIKSKMLDHKKTVHLV